MVFRHVVTLANSIVGVSVLAMPFCFKQCGIVLATLSLTMGAVMTRMVCYFLLKAAIMSRRRTYEMLAWSTFGHTGKFMVEISIIGFLIGTLIAFMVVIGDLGPEILSEIFAVENNSSLRTIIMTALSLFVALPLGLLRNIDSLGSVSTAAIIFYVVLVLKIFSEGIGPLWSGEYLERIAFWKAGGVLQCIPIFSMALSCQTQIFGIYDSLPEPSLQKMNEVVKKAVNVCTFFYFSVGFFGYIAFSQQNFGGNILLSFPNSWSTQIIKSMFLMSVVFSVPLVIFPLRASLHSLIFRSSSSYHHVHDISTNYIPESRMKLLTVTIVGTCLIVGIWIPNIELVLGLVGATTGSVICIIFPSIMFVRVTSKSTTERLLAQLMFFIGVVLMLLTTYATLYAAEQSQVNEKLHEPLRVTENINILPLKPVLSQGDVQLNSPISSPNVDDGKGDLHRVEFEHKLPEKMISNKNNGRQVILPRKESTSRKPDIKKEEPVLERVDEPEHEKKKAPFEDPGQEVKLEQLDTFKDSLDKDRHKHEEIKKEKSNLQMNSAHQKDKIDKEIVSQSNLKLKKPNPAENPVDNLDLNPDKPPALNKPIQDAIIVPEKEDVGKGDGEKKEFVEKHVAEEFLKRLEVHQENQKKLIEEQKEILEELKQHHAQDVRDKLGKDDHKKNFPEPLTPEKKSEKLESGDNLPLPIANSKTSDKIILEQEKIIEKISENLEKESNNAQLLEKLEEGLNKEVKMLDKDHDKAKTLNVNPNINPNQKLKEEKPPSVLQTMTDMKQVNVDHNQDLKSEKDGNHNFNVDSVHLNAKLNNDQKEEARNNDVLKNVDKEKGVLVGSLAGNKPSLSDLETKVKLDNVLEEVKDNVGINLNHKTMANTKNEEGGVKAERDLHEKKIYEHIQNPIQEHRKAQAIVQDQVSKIVVSSSTKKSVVGSVPKDKIDREI